MSAGARAIRIGRRRDEARRNGEQGVVVVLVTLLLVALLAFGAIAIDLGASYARGREAQNAADAAALAGARALDEVKYAGATWGLVDTTVGTIANQNGAGTVACSVVAAYDSKTMTSPTTIGRCDDRTAVTDPRAAGVLVSAGKTSKTYFGRVIGFSTTSVSRDAAATIQSVRTADAPIYACYTGQMDGDTPLPDLLIKDASGAWVDNPAATQPDVTGAKPRYQLHGPHVATCGLQSDGWKGGAGDTHPTITPPGVWLPVDTGVSAGPMRTTIAGKPSCSDLSTLQCVLLLPICVNSNALGGSNGSLFCVTWGAFRLIEATSNTHTFEFEGRVTLTRGSGGPALPGAADPRLIKLVV